MLNPSAKKIETQTQTSELVAEFLKNQVIVRYPTAVAGGLPKRKYLRKKTS